MNKYILENKVQEYIISNTKLDPYSIALKKSPFTNISSTELAAQIDGRQRALKKLPTWAYTPNIYFPDKINIEQCSSEHTALIKQSLIKKGSKVVDVTGGFSVDSCYMAQEAEYVIHCELNENLSNIVKHNAKTLGVHNLKPIFTDGVKYIESLEDNSIDYIYIDPSRRVNHSKVFLLEDCEPNIIELQHIFFSKSKNILCKLSPLMDINSALQKLKHVKSVYIISVDGDCKELIFFQERNYSGQVNLNSIRLYSDKIQLFTFTLEQEKNAIAKNSEPLKYLYDPDVSITKAGAFKSIADKFNLYKLHAHTHLYTSNDQVDNFPGRAFNIDKILTLSEFKKLKISFNANVATKNFPLKVDQVRKKFKIKDGGNTYLFFTTDHLENLIVIYCSKIV